MQCQDLLTVKKKLKTYNAILRGGPHDGVKLMKLTGDLAFRTYRNTGVWEDGFLIYAFNG